MVETGAEVQVVMTEAAEQFVTATTFQALSGRPVRHSLWDEEAEAAMGHIELARWPDLILVAPASADFLARLAGGRADDLLSTVCLASAKPLAVAPAMNQQMWANAATQGNLAQLIDRGVTVLQPGSGEQACGDIGTGRMQEPLAIRAAAVEMLSAGPLRGVRVAINAGPTREAIDPVRAISNRSSGKMGFTLAAALRALGARVTLIAGPVALPTPGGVRRIDVESAADMLEASLQQAAEAEIFIGTAAVADYTPVEAAEHKIKKHDEELTLRLKRTTDILQAVRAAQPALFMAGFAAETRDLESAARDKLARKGLDLIAANDVSDGQAFDRDDNALIVFWADGRSDLGHGSKADLARRLAALIADRFHTAKSNENRA